MSFKALITVIMLLVLSLSGCARRVPVAELEDRGADVGAVVTLENGDTFRCRVLSLSRDELLVEIYYPIGGDVELRGSGADLRVVVGGERVLGEITSIERDGISRTALVRRTIPVDDVSHATFHRSGSEASLGPILSLFVGPVVGALLALAI